MGQSLAMPFCQMILSVIKVEKVDLTFHARYDPKGKEYRYFIRRSTVKRSFYTSLCNFNMRYPLRCRDNERRRALYLLGTHDFTSFCSAKTEVVDKVRTITKIELIEDG